MLINNARVKVLSAPRTGVSRTGNNYTISDIVLGWQEEAKDQQGNPMVVENTIHTTLGAQWVDYTRQIGLQVGDTVNVEIRLQVRSRGQFYVNDVAIVGLTKV